MSYHSDSETEIGPSSQMLSTTRSLSAPSIKPPTPRSRTPSPPPRTPSPNIRPPTPLKMSKDSARSIPKIEPRLTGQHNYAEWVSSVEMALTMYDIGSHTIWDIVTGACTSAPAAGASSTAGSGKSTATTTLTEAKWTKANYFAVLTMYKTVNPELC